MMRRLLQGLVLVFLGMLTVACGFHLQGKMKLAPPFKHMFLQTPDPYGQLERSLEQNLKLSSVQIALSPAEATTILLVTRDDTSQTLLSVSGTQQTRQYALNAAVTFMVTDTRGAAIIGPTTLEETRIITVQSNQILGSSNEASLFYQQMRRALAYRILYVMASRQSTQAVNNYLFQNMPPS